MCPAGGDVQDTAPPSLPLTSTHFPHPPHTSLTLPTPPGKTTKMDIYSKYHFSVKSVIVSAPVEVVEIAVMVVVVIVVGMG